MLENTGIVPKEGYILPNWKSTHAYRSTAIAYLEREGLYTVEHKDGKWYTLTELKKARLGNHDKNQTQNPRD